MAKELTCEEVYEPSEPQPEIDDERHVRLWGGLDPPPNWVEYLADFEADYRPTIEAARRWLEAREGAIPMAGDWCNDNYLRFSDGTTLTFTWRAWGDFAQAVVDKREGYMAYYS